MSGPRKQPALSSTVEALTTRRQSWWGWLNPVLHEEGVGVFHVALHDGGHTPLAEMQEELGKAGRDVQLAAEGVDMLVQEVLGLLDVQTFETCVEREEEGEQAN